MFDRCGNRFVDRLPGRLDGLDSLQFHFFRKHVDVRKLGRHGGDGDL